MQDRDGNALPIRGPREETPRRVMRGIVTRGDFLALAQHAHARHQIVIEGFARGGGRGIGETQPHPGTPIEHTVANGVGKNGGDTAIDGPTFLSTIGWDWLPAVRDRDTGIYQPVTLYSTGDVLIQNPFVTADLADSHATADLTLKATLSNRSDKPVEGTLVGKISGQGSEITFRKPVTLPANAATETSFDTVSTPELHIIAPKLWWPNGYGPQNLYVLSTSSFETG